MSRPKISICIAHHNAHVMLRAQYSRLGSYSPKIMQHVELVVCDDASDYAPIHPWHYTIQGKLFRIRPPHVRWSHRCATNIAAFEASGAWLLLTDVDHIVPSATLQYLIDAPLNGNIVYTFGRVSPSGEVMKSHPDSWLIHRTLWKEIGGWDERYRGYYGQNGNIWRRIRWHAGEPHEVPVHLVRFTNADVPDAEQPEAMRQNRLADKAVVNGMRKRFVRAGTFYDSHQLTAPYDRVPKC